MFIHFVPNNTLLVKFYSKSDLILTQIVNGLNWLYWELFDVVFLKQASMRSGLLRDQ